MAVERERKTALWESERVGKRHADHCRIIGFDTKCDIFLKIPLRLRGPQRYGRHGRCPDPALLLRYVHLRLPELLPRLPQRNRRHIRQGDDQPRRRLLEGRPNAGAGVLNGGDGRIDVRLPNSGEGLR